MWRSIRCSYLTKIKKNFFQKIKENLHTYQLLPLDVRLKNLEFVGTLSRTQAKSQHAQQSLYLLNKKAKYPIYHGAISPYDKIKLYAIHTDTYQRPHRL